MPAVPGWRKIKYEADLDPGFADEIAAVPGGEKIFNCIQCGTCSGMCPLSPDMDYTPRRIIAMIRAGFRQEVLSSYTSWLCASCYSCTVECPKTIKITDIMYAVKRLAIQEEVFPKRFPITVLAKEFFNCVRSKGRNSEGRLMMRLYLKTNPFKALNQAVMGFRLWTQGRIGIGSESISRKQELHNLIDALDKEEILARKKPSATVKEGL
jgi:quinone-modifying oxidoreductase, subunit QmoC